MRIYFYGKWFIDRLVSLLSLILLSPIFIALSLLIKLDSKGPVFFKQRRIGLRKKEFYILKFRTMSIDAPKNTPTHLLENPEQYITRLGAFLRRSSLDELPQLINILKGDMSIVGPRPALWNQYDLITARDKYGANDIYPGLTGWAQVNGRDELEIELKASFDGEYVERMSLIFDIKIFLRTILSVFKKQGIVEGSQKEKVEV